MSGALEAIDPSERPEPLTASVGTAPARRAPGSLRRGPVYCIVPRELEPAVAAALIEHFAADRAVEVIEDRRTGERRRQVDRRRLAGPRYDERRLIRNLNGRRVGERRATLERCAAPGLPPAVAEAARQLEFVRRIAPSAERIADLEDLRLVTQLQAGSRSAFDAIYERYLSRLHVYARAALDDPHEAEDVAHEVLITMLEEVGDYEVRGIPFRIWVFRVLQNQVRKNLAKKRRLVVEDPLALHTRVEAAGLSGGAGPVSLDQRLFDRIADSGFMDRIERLSKPQRQVLVLRFLLGFDLEEAARLLGITPNAAANLQYRALAALRSRGQRECEREPSTARFGMRRLRGTSLVGESRRVALHAFSW